MDLKINLRHFTPLVLSWIIHPSLNKHVFVLCFIHLPSKNSPKCKNVSRTRFMFSHWSVQFLSILRLRNTRPNQTASLELVLFAKRGDHQLLKYYVFAINCKGPSSSCKERVHSKLISGRLIKQDRRQFIHTFPGCKFWFSPSDIMITESRVTTLNMQCCQYHSKYTPLLHRTAKQVWKNDNAGIAPKSHNNNFANIRVISCVMGWPSWLPSWLIIAMAGGLAVRGSLITLINW